MIKILVIDDAFFLRNVLKKAINNNPDKLYTVIGEAKDGAEGLTMTKILAPDIITVDLNMPNMNGINFIKQLRQIDTNIKIVTISSNTNINTGKEVLEIGANGYIKKPFKETEIWDTFKKIYINEPIIKKDDEPMVEKNISEINEVPIIQSKLNSSIKSDNKINSEDKKKDNTLILESIKEKIEIIDVKEENEEVENKNNSIIKNSTKKTKNKTSVQCIPKDYLEKYKKNNIKTSPNNMIINKKGEIDNIQKNTAVVVIPKSLIPDVSKNGKVSMSTKEKKEIVVATIPIKNIKSVSPEIKKTIIEAAKEIKVIEEVNFIKDGNEEIIKKSIAGNVINVNIIDNPIGIIKPETEYSEKLNNEIKIYSPINEPIKDKRIEDINKFDKNSDIGDDDEIYIIEPEILDGTYPNKLDKVDVIETKKDIILNDDELIIEYIDEENNKDSNEEENKDLIFKKPIQNINKSANIKLENEEFADNSESINLINLNKDTNFDILDEGLSFNIDEELPKENQINNDLDKYINEEVVFNINDIAPNQNITNNSEVVQKNVINKELNNYNDTKEQIIYPKIMPEISPPKDVVLKEIYSKTMQENYNIFFDESEEEIIVPKKNIIWRIFEHFKNKKNKK